MELMYPHPVDRFRLIQRLATSARSNYRSQTPGFSQVGINQEGLARRAGVSQATVSNVENLEKTVGSSSRRVRREDLLKVLTWGLELTRDHVDAILWLFDGEPLREDEIRRYVRGYQPDPTSARSTAEQLRQRVLDLLRSAVEQSFEPEGSQTAEVRVFSADQRGRIAVEQARYEFDQIPGQRLVATARPKTVATAASFMQAHATERATIEQLQEVIDPIYRLEDRVSTFLQNVGTYGERSILTKASLEHYLSAKDGYRLSLEQRRAIIRCWCEMFRASPHYEVALADATPDLEPLIKSTKQAFLRASSLEYRREREISAGSWGPRYVLWLDEVSVTSFLLDFEAHWRRIPVDDRTKDGVLAWFDERLVS